MFSRKLYYFFFRYFLILPFIALFFSCSPTRRLGENEYLLNKSRINLKSKDINIIELKPYEKQKPNKTILGLKFHLFLYNLPDPSKQKGFAGWLKEIGEEPVIWDPALTDRTSEQFKRYLQTRGFYDVTVTDSVYLNKKKASTFYDIKLNEPYRLNSITYKFEDPNLMEYVMKDTSNCLIKKGGRFDKEVIQSERQRLEDLLKSKGYYRFSKEYIFFEAREVPGKKLIDLQILIKENITGVPDPETKVRHHDRYKISRTYIMPDFAALGQDSESDGSNINPEERIDTVIIDKNRIIYSGRQRIKPEAVLFSNLCTPGSIYNLNNVRKSNSNYSALGLFRMINIHFRDYGSGQPDSSGFRYLDCFIELTPRKIQSYQTEIVGTVSSGNLGMRANLLYNNYNLFHGAENFQVNLTGAIESRRKENENFSFQDPMREYGIEAILSYPKFFVPFRAQEFTRKFNPRSLINASYNYQNHPDKYVRTIANTSLSYRWKGNAYNTHQFYPIDFSYVRITDVKLTEQEITDLFGSSYKSSFEDHTILAARYTFDFTTQVIEKKEDFFKIRTNLESAGNVIYGITRLTPTENDSALFMKVPYSRYLKGDIDLRIYDQIAPGNKLVYRFFAGMGYPLGDSRVLPYEKMYSAGGPNDIRAWDSDELGPGSDTTKLPSYMYKAGDIKLEANLEYRFKLFWVIEGAFFIDAGNIWMYNPDEEKEGISTAFRWDQFYKEIAVGTGLGTRFDFSFLMIRFDFGIKMRDPAILTGNKWIDLNQELDYGFKDRLSLKFGIGYPF